MTAVLDNIVKRENFVRPKAVMDERAVRWLNWDLFCLKNYLTALGSGNDGEINFVELIDLATQKYLGDFPKFADAMACEFEQQIMPFASKKLQETISNCRSSVGSILGVNGNVLGSRLVLSIWEHFEELLNVEKDNSTACETLKEQYKGKPFFITVHHSLGICYRYLHEHAC